MARRGGPDLLGTLAIGGGIFLVIDYFFNGPCKHWFPLFNMWDARCAGQSGTIVGLQHFRNLIGGETLFGQQPTGSGSRGGTGSGSGGGGGGIRGSTGVSPQPALNVRGSGSVGAGAGASGGGGVSIPNLVNRCFPAAGGSLKGRLYCQCGGASPFLMGQTRTCSDCTAHCRGTAGTSRSPATKTPRSTSPPTPVAKDCGFAGILCWGERLASGQTIFGQNANPLGIPFPNPGLGIRVPIIAR